MFKAAFWSWILDTAKSYWSEEWQKSNLSGELKYFFDVLAAFWSAELKGGVYKT